MSPNPIDLGALESIASAYKGRCPLCDEDKAEFKKERDLLRAKLERAEKALQKIVNVPCSHHVAYMNLLEAAEIAKKALEANANE